jgi:hypothetical protein
LIDWLVVYANFNSISAISLRDILTPKKPEKHQKYHTIGTALKSSSRIIESGKSNTPNTQNTWPLIFLVGTGTSIKSGSFKVVLWVPLSEMIRSCTCSLHVSKTPTLTVNQMNRVLTQMISSYDLLATKYLSVTIYIIFLHLSTQSCYIFVRYMYIYAE